MTEISIITENGKQKDYIPLEVAKRIWDGTSPVRAWREQRGMTQAALASACGVARAFLSQIETGRRGMSVSTLRKLADALDTDMEFLIRS